VYNICIRNGGSNEITELEKSVDKLKSIETVLKDSRSQFLESKSLSEPGKISIVACIPAYNEERSIASVILKTQKYVDEVIVCDDGSADLTAMIAEGLDAFVVNHEVNQGKGAALRSSMREALKRDPDYVVVLDADGQHDPDEIPSLITPLGDGEADMVIGSRYIQGDNSEAPFYRKIGLGIIDRVFKFNINDDVQDSQSGFRAYTREAVTRVVVAKSNGFGVESEQLSLATENGFRIKEVPVNIRYNGLENTSKMNPLSHGAEIIGSILNLVVTKRPLLLLGTPGIFSLVMGIIALGFFVFYYNINGYISIPFALLTATGVILGTMLILVSLILYAINEVNKHNHQ